MKPILIFIGGPVDAVEAIKRARLEYSPWLADLDSSCPGRVYCDKFIKASTYDSDAIIDKLNNSIGDNKIAGVVAVACDVGPTVSKVASALDCPRIPWEISILSYDKPKLKDRLFSGGVEVPRLDPSRVNYKVIIKPIDGRGGRGVYLINDHEIEDYRDDSLKYSSSGKIVIEPFIPGDQVSTESIVWRGDVVFTGLTDRDYSDLEKTKPSVIESGGWSPSKYEGTEIGQHIKDVIVQCAKTLNIENGTVKGDVVLRDNKQPMVIELAIGRMSGGQSCTKYIPWGYGVDFLGAAFAVATGQDPRPYLLVKKTPLHVRGKYRNFLSATNHTERGQIDFFTGHSRAEAIHKSRKFRWG